jgi:hypothetical protein
MLSVDKVRLRGRYYLHLRSHLDKFLLMEFIALGKKVVTLCFSRSLIILLDEHKFHIIKLFAV